MDVSTSSPLSTSYNTSRDSLIGQCKWTAFNWLLTGFLSLTLLVNVMAAFVIFRVPVTNHRKTPNPVYLCIRLLNITDMVQSFFLGVTPLLSSEDCEWFGGESCCKAMGFFALLFVMVSPLITVIMAIDRTIAIYWPVKYREYLGLKALKSLAAIFAIFIFILIFPPLLGVGEYHVVRGRRLCLLDTITSDDIDRAYVIAVHAVFLAFLLFMIASTVAFLRKFDALYRRSERSKIWRRKANSATVTTVAICSTFVCCYTPFVIRVLYEASTMQKSPGWITWSTFAVALLQPFLNPIVCLLCNVRCRQELTMILRRRRDGESILSFSRKTGKWETPFVDLSNRIKFHSRNRSDSHRTPLRQQTSEKKDLNFIAKQLQSQSSASATVASEKIESEVKSSQSNAFPDDRSSSLCNPYHKEESLSEGAGDIINPQHFMNDNSVVIAHDCDSANKAMNIRLSQRDSGVYSSSQIKCSEDYCDIRQ